MLIVPLQPVASQQVSVILSNQNCQFNIQQRNSAIFIDVLVNNFPIIQGVICENKNKIVRDAYLGFIGDVAFIDNQGDSDPEYTGLGTRYSLAYLLPDEEFI